MTRELTKLLAYVADELLEDCDLCGACHRRSYIGDCRNDAERFHDARDFLLRTVPGSLTE
jgi:hypothetical protein